MRRHSVQAAKIILLCALSVMLCAPSIAVAAPRPPEGKVRTYYVAADEVTWNYAPSGRDEAMGMPFDSIAKVFTQSGPHQIQGTFKKAVYREYTDGSFTTLKKQPPMKPIWG